MPPRQVPIVDRIRRSVAIDEAGCWRWQLRIDRHGYGRISIYRRGQNYLPALAHRISYQAFVGDIPSGLELDHLCRVRDCVNPAHLEPVTHEENMRRAPQSYPACGHDHTSDADWYFYPDGHRECRACRRIRGAAWAAAHPARVRERNREAVQRYRARKRANAVEGGAS